MGAEVGDLAVGATQQRIGVRKRRRRTDSRKPETESYDDLVSASTGDIGCARRVEQPSLDLIEGERPVSSCDCLIDCPSWIGRQKQNGYVAVDWAQGDSRSDRSPVVAGMAVAVAGDGDSEARMVPAGWGNWRGAIFAVVAPL